MEVIEFTIENKLLVQLIIGSMGLIWFFLALFENGTKLEFKFAIDNNVKFIRNIISVIIIFLSFYYAINVAVNSNALELKVNKNEKAINKIKGNENAKNN